MRFDISTVAAVSTRYLFLIKFFFICIYLFIYLFMCSYGYPYPLPSELFFKRGRLVRVEKAEQKPKQMKIVIKVQH